MRIIKTRTMPDKVWSFLWLLQVHGWDPKRHCKACLKGTAPAKLSRFGDWRLELPETGSPIFYLCGGSSPYIYARNLHVGFERAPGESFTREGWSGDLFTFQDAREIPFDDKAAKRLQPNKSDAFLTCRNYQFGAQAFGDPQ